MYRKSLASSGGFTESVSLYMGFAKENTVIFVYLVSSHSSNEQLARSTPHSHMFLIFPHFHNLLQNLKFWDFLPKVHCLSTPHSHSTIPCHVRKIFLFQFCGNTPVKCLRKNYFVTVNKYKCIVHRCFVRTIFKKIKWYVHVYCWVITWGPKSPGPSPKVKANASKTHTHTHTPFKSARQKD